MRAPAAASRRHVARPMPRDPPVTSAVLPSSGVGRVGLIRSLPALQTHGQSRTPAQAIRPFESARVAGHDADETGARREGEHHDPDRPEPALVGEAVASGGERAQEDQRPVSLGIGQRRIGWCIPRLSCLAAANEVRAMQPLSSYLAGSWRQGAGDPAVLVNPSTEEPLAEIRPAGSLDEAVAFARARGGPALRELSFAQRGELLLGLSKLIHQIRDELIELALRNGGNTRQDAKFDIDGAIGALVHYAELGAKLGAGRVLLDGEPDQIGRSPRLVG